MWLLSVTCDSHPYASDSLSVSEPAFFETLVFANICTYSHPPPMFLSRRAAHAPSSIAYARVIL